MQKKLKKFRGTINVQYIISVKSLQKYLECQTVL